MGFESDLGGAGTRDSGLKGRDVELHEGARGRATAESRRGSRLSARVACRIHACKHTPSSRARARVCHNRAERTSRAVNVILPLGRQRGDLQSCETATCLRIVSESSAPRQNSLCGAQIRPESRRVYKSPELKPADCAWINAQICGCVVSPLPPSPDSLRCSHRAVKANLLQPLGLATAIRYHFGS